VLTRRHLLAAGGTAAAGTATALVPATTAAALVPAGTAATRTGPTRRPGARTLRVVAWNIFRGGRGLEENGIDAGADNVSLIVDQLVALDADVCLLVETYGSGRRITRGLEQRGRLSWTGHQVTRRSDDSDNLWVLTRLPVERTLPAPTGPLTTDFNLGGLRVRTRPGRSVDVLVNWTTYTNPWVGYLVDENAAALRAGLEPRHSAEDVEAADRVQTASLREIVDRHLPAMLSGGDVPVVIGGDFNTNAHQDWSARWADAPEHFGMAYELPATRVLTDAGFVDTFRAVHPDAGAVQGRTWSPFPYEHMITPSRIDMVYARGLTPTGSWTVDTRWSGHEPGPFYSDHAAVVTDLRL
jgi:hypothetical protein